jgi:hypothetical protein
MDTLSGTVVDLILCIGKHTKGLGLSGLPQSKRLKTLLTVDVEETEIANLHNVETKAGLEAFNSTLKENSIRS